MSDHVSRPSCYEDATSMTSSQAHQSSWMSRWNNRFSKPGSTVVDNCSLVRDKEGHCDVRGHLMQNERKVISNAEELKTGILSEKLSEIPGNFGNKANNLSFQTLKLFRSKEKVPTCGTQADLEFGHPSVALTLAIGNKEGTSRDVNSRSGKQPFMSHLYQEQKGMALSRSCTYEKSDASKPVTVFERHFSNDNFTYFSKERCKFQKSSSILFHEKKLENDVRHDSGLCDELHLQHGCPSGKKNFQSFFLKKQSQNHPGQPLKRIPCSFHNVETMRICTMVDSVENLPGDPPKFSQRAHHILFTKETCVNMSKAHREEKMFDGSYNMSPNAYSRGMKIQPLWTSTDCEEKDMTGIPSSCRVGSRNEASAETNGMQLGPSMANGKGKRFGGYLSMSPNVAFQSRGVKIQPLWNSTDSEEKEVTGNFSICKASSRNEASAETDGLQIEAPKNRRIYLGMESSPFTKDDTVQENSSPAKCDSSTEKARSIRPGSPAAWDSSTEKSRSKRPGSPAACDSSTEKARSKRPDSPAACDSSSEKARSKRPMTEIPDINEELPGLQPAVSSTDGKEPSTSRVHSLNAKQLFSCHEQNSKPKCNNAGQERTYGPDTSSRWIKRLKLNSSDSFGAGTKCSDMGEGTSNEKFNMFFKRMMKCNRESFDAKLHKHHGNELMEIDQNVKSIRNGGSLSMGSKKRNRSMMLGCSWIQRWSQSCTTSTPSKPEPLVICEPHSMKTGQDEVAKKQFPSIAAMALMGKAMNGFNSCEFKRTGSVVVWNTKEY